MPDHRAQRRDHDGEAHRVPEQRGGERAEQERRERRPAVLRGLEQPGRPAAGAATTATTARRRRSHGVPRRAARTRGAPAARGRRGGRSRRQPAAGPSLTSSCACLEQRDGRRPVAELGQGDRVRLAAGRQRRSAAGLAVTARGQRVLEAVAVGDDLLALRADQEGDEPLGRRPGACSRRGPRPPRRRARSPGRLGRRRRAASACCPRPPRPAGGTSSTG